MWPHGWRSRGGDGNGREAPALAPQTKAVRCPPGREKTSLRM
ncbi:hypothetical protein HVPorG_04002 [Roseomonas mucosa]|nr:hypothetical protein HVPorG_04002 [Roseomonas mucosa]